MLPFPDAPLDAKPLLKRSLAPARRPAKVLDRRLAEALADPDRVIFLDVETTGLSWFYDELTIVGWLCDRNYHLHLAGDDPAPLVQRPRTSARAYRFAISCQTSRPRRRSEGN